MEEKPDWIKEISILSIKPGDKIVVKCDDFLDDHTIATFKEAFAKWFPQNLTVVLCGGIDIEIVRPEFSEKGAPNEN